jgi:hypothetical protein
MVETDTANTTNRDVSCGHLTKPIPWSKVHPEELTFLLGDPKVHYSAHKNSSLVLILSTTDQALNTIFA